MLMIAFGLCLLLLIAAVTDLSAAFLRRQSATSLADGAALAASDAAAAAAVYSGTEDAYVRFDETAVAGAVEVYLREVGAYAAYPGLVPQVQVDATVVTVRITMPYDLPIPVPGVADTVTIDADSSVQMPIYQD